MKRDNKSSISIFGLKIPSLVLVMLVFLSVRIEANESAPPPHKNINVTVESSQLEPFSIDEKTEPKEKRAVFYSDQNSSVDINENGEPNLNMRF